MIDPRAEEAHDQIRHLDSQIAKLQDELKILQKQKRMQVTTLRKLNHNPNMDRKLEETKKELVETKAMVKKYDGELRDILNKGHIHVSH